MYPFADVREGYDTLWSMVRARIGVGPERLDHDIDIHDSWRRDDLVLGQTCGWPLVTQLPELVVVGALEPMVDHAEGHRYRSVVVASKASPTGVVAANSPDSLSGWVSLVHALGRVPADVLWTGSHAESLRAVGEGRADTASLDAVTWVHLRRIAPERAQSVTVTGLGPLVPSLPLVMAPRFADLLPAMRQALAEIVTSPEFVAWADRLRIAGFVPLDRHEYEGLRALEPRATH